MMGATWAATVARFLQIAAHYLGLTTTTPEATAEQSPTNAEGSTQ
jgi:hypothetical protein